MCWPNLKVHKNYLVKKDRSDKLSNKKWYRIEFNATAMGNLNFHMYHLVILNSKYGVLVVLVEDLAIGLIFTGPFKGESR